MAPCLVQCVCTEVKRFFFFLKRNKTKTGWDFFWIFLYLPRMKGTLQSIQNKDEKHEVVRKKR